VVCNEAAHGRRVNTKLSWHDQALYALLIAPAIYVIAAAVVSKRARVALPLCARHRQRRLLSWVIGLGGGLAGVAMFILAAIYLPPAAMLLGLLTMFALPIIGVVMGRMWRAVHIDDRLVRLRCGAAFVASLPYAPPDMHLPASYMPRPQDPYAIFGASPSGFVVPAQWGFGRR
jgi:hypothetical protein